MRSKLIRRIAGLSGIACLGLAVPTSAPGQTPPRADAVQPPALPIGRDALVRVEDRPEDRIVEYVIGPVRLDSGTANLRTPVQMSRIPVAGWFHGFDVSIRDAAGNRIPIETLQHVNFIDPDQRELFSPVARRVMAAGPQSIHQRLPGLVGYPVQPGDRLLIAAKFANPTDTDIPAAYLHVAFDYSLEGEKLIEPRNIYPFHLDVMGYVGVKRFVVPPGRSRRAWQGSPAVAGRILALGGHVHDFATELRLVDVTDGTEMWKVEPSLDRDGQVEDVPRREMWWRLGKHVYPDHVYRIEVAYDNPLDIDAPTGGTGEIGGVILVEKGIAWPRLETTNPMYAADLESTLSAPERSDAEQLAP